MRNVLLSVLAVCVGTLLVATGCSDTTEPLGLIVAPGEALAQTSTGGEICWYLDSTHPDYKRHVVSKEADFDTDWFGWALPPEGFFPEGAWLVTGAVRLYEDGAYDVRVGNGYMVTAVVKNRNKYDMYHQVVLQPWIGTAWAYNPESLCDKTAEVRVCLAYDNDGNDPGAGDGACTAWETRTACMGAFLGEQSQSCNRLPCTTRGGLSFVSGSWTGFIQDLSGNVNNQGRLDSYDDGDPVAYGWPHGRLCVKFGPGDEPPPVEPPGEGEITLTATLRTAGKNGFADLVWSGATTSQVDIYRNGARLTTSNNSGSYSDRLPGTGSYAYTVCEAGSTTACSGEAVVTW
jgi:hypothetical protein